jgi:hypothetical protein
MSDKTGIERDASASVECRDQRPEAFALGPHVIGQVPSGSATLVDGKAHHEPRLLGLGVHVRQHASAEQLGPRPRDGGLPLLAELGRTPARRSPPQVGVVMQDDLGTSECPGNPFNSLAMRHGPTDCRIVGGQPIRVRDVDRSICIGQAGEVGHRRLVYRHYGVRRPGCVSFSPKAEMPRPVVRALGGFGIVHGTRRVNEDIAHTQDFIFTSFTMSDAAPAGQGVREFPRVPETAEAA